MQQTFEHLLGLTAASALAILTGYGIMDVAVIPTAAPPARRKSADSAKGAADVAAEGTASAAPADEAPDVLTEARVMAVRDDGRTLIVSRFHVGDPPDAPRA